MFSRKSSKQKKDYSRDVALPVPILDHDEVLDVATILDYTSIPMKSFKPDKVNSRFQAQTISINASKELNHYSIEFTGLSSRRDYVTVSKCIIVYLGHYNRSEGKVALRLRDAAYKDTAKQIEFEQEGCIGGMWGIAGAMCNCKHKEDKDQLFLEVEISTNDLNDSVIAEVFILWEFEETDFPLQYVSHVSRKFMFNPIEKQDGLASACYQTWEIFQKIAKGKLKMCALKSHLNTTTFHESNNVIDLTGDLPKNLFKEDDSKDDNKSQSSSGSLPMLM